MALSSYLTRDEWNASYFAFYYLVFRGDQQPSDLSTHLRMGIVTLYDMGYRNWQGVEVLGSNPDGVMKRQAINHSRNEGCLVEILNGTLNLRERAAETILWLNHHPEIQPFFAADFHLFLAAFVEVT